MIRKAKLEDITKISEIMKVLDIPNLQPSNHENIRKFIEKEEYYVAINNAEVVGAMSLIIEEDSCQIYSISSKLKGAGRELIRYAIELCKERRVPKIWCWSLTRYNAQGFYEKMGFEEKFLMKKQWLEEDCYIFGKIVE